jgi:hypothetical protein
VTPQLWSQGLVELDENVLIAHSQSMTVIEHVVNHFHSGRAHAGLVAQRGAPARRRVGEPWRATQLRSRAASSAPHLTSAVRCRAPARR